MKKILLMSLSILISSTLTTRFSYATEGIEFTDKEEYLFDYINTYAGTEDETFIINYIAEDNENHYFQQNNYLKSEQDTLLDNLRMPPPLPLKSKSSNGRKKVKLTTAEINKNTLIYNAGVDGLKNLKLVPRKMWEKIFKDGLLLEECLERRRMHKRTRLYRKRYRVNPEVKKREKEYHKEYLTRPEVKKRVRKYYESRKRKRNENKEIGTKEIDIAENNRPTKKRKVE